MFRWLIFLGLMSLLVACNGGVAPTVSPTNDSEPTSTSISSLTFEGVSGERVKGCDANLLAIWEPKFYFPSDMTDLDEINRIEQAFKALNYPECVAQARTHALQAYAAVARLAEAKAVATATPGNNMATEIRTYETNLLAAMSAFEIAMSAIVIEQPSLPTPVPTDVVPCPNLSYTCSQLSCAQAYACQLDGNDKLDGDENGVPCDSICRP